MIQLQWNNGEGFADLVEIDSAAALEGDDITTAVIISLFTEQRLEAFEVADGASRGGWWGSAFPAIAGDVEGSRVWLAAARGRDDAEAINIIREGAELALQWLLDDGVAESVVVEVERLRPGVIHLHVSVQIDGDWRPRISFTLSPQ